MQTIAKELSTKAIDATFGLLLNGYIWAGLGIIVAALLILRWWNHLSSQEKRAFKTAAIACLIVAAVTAWQGYQYGAKASQTDYRFINYIDGKAVEVAKDMQAMCDRRQICKAPEIQARWEDATEVGKVKARLQRRS